MKKLVLPLALLALSGFAGEYTLKQAPQTLDDWTNDTFYVEGDLPTTGDTVILPANMNAKVDDDSIGFVNSFLRIKPLNISTSVLTVDISSDHELKCAFYNRTREWSSATFTSGRIVKLGNGTLSLASTSAAGHDYFTDLDVQEGTLKLYSSSASTTYYYGRINVGPNGLLIPGASASNVVANYMISLSGSGIVSNGVGSAANCWLMPGYGEGSPSVFSGKILDKIMWYSHGFQYLTNPSNTFSGGVQLILNKDMLTQGILGAVNMGMAGEPSAIGINTRIVLSENGGRFLYLGDGETTDKSIHISETAAGKTYGGIVDAGSTGGLVINGGITFSTSGVTHRLGLDGSNTIASAVNGKIEKNGSTYGYLTKKGSGTWHLGNDDNDGIGGIAVEKGTLAFSMMSERGYASSLGDGSLFTVDKWVQTSENRETVPYLLKLGTESSCGTLEFAGTNVPVANSSSPMVLAGDGCLRNSATNAAGKELGWFYNAGISSLTSGTKKLTLDGSNSVESVVGGISDGAGKVALEKTGLGVWVLAGTNNTFTGDIAVRGGKLIIRGIAGQFKFFRWTIRQVHSGYLIGVPEFAMFDKDNKRVDKGLQRNELSGTSFNKMDEFSIPLLRPGEVAYGKRLDGINHNHGAWYLEKMFTDASYGTHGWSMYSDSNPLTVGNEAAWIPVVMRHVADANEVCSYDFTVVAGSNARIPQSWKMEGSVDGFTWYMIDDVTDAPWPASEFLWVFSGGAYRNGWAATHSGGRPLTGSTNDVTVVYQNAVSVDSGATLEADGLVELRSLKVDVAGAGTVKGFSFGTNGVVDITRSSGVTDLPIAIENCAGTEHLSNWSVSVGGVPRSRKHLVFKNGVLTLIQAGATITFR